MGKHTKKEFLAELRKEMVARFRLQGMSIRAIREALYHVQNNHKEFVLRSPTSKDGMWSTSTIKSDLTKSLKEWKKERLDSTENHLASLLAELDEIRRVSWEKKDVYGVLGAIDRKVKLLGLNEPEEDKETKITVVFGEPIDENH